MPTPKRCSLCGLALERCVLHGPALERCVLHGPALERSLLHGCGADNLFVGIATPHKPRLAMTLIKLVVIAKQSPILRGALLMHLMGFAL